MERCRTCKHWKTPWDEGNEPGDAAYEMGKAGEETSRWGMCQLIGLGWEAGSDLSAFTQDASDYKATLHTRDDFGCMLHEPALVTH